MPPIFDPEIHIFLFDLQQRRYSKIILALSTTKKPVSDLIDYCDGCDDIMDKEPISPGDVDCGI
jgi:hypothetical protein